MEQNNEPYVYDCLYGIIRLPSFVWEILPSTELQRLREVRLCNSNLLCFPGGSNINRYEHSVGTCYLALECLKHRPFSFLTSEEERQFVLAALLHDITSAPFGHSVDYIESKDGYEHERSFGRVVFDEENTKYPYSDGTFEQIFFGLQKELSSLVTHEDLVEIGKIVTGQGRLGMLLNGSMDLDNIDNIFRLSYHIGFTKSGELPLKLARSLWTDAGNLIVREDSLQLVEQWFNLRKKMYTFLLLNPEEFSAKCMLSDAIEFAKEKTRRTFSWHDTDYDFLKKLYGAASTKTNAKKRLFSIDQKFVEEFADLRIGESLRRVFLDNGIDLSQEANVVTGENEWVINDKTCEYHVIASRTQLEVYKLSPMPIEIRKIVRRFMKGDLYGCLGLFTSSRVEKKDMLEITHKKRDLENLISEEIRTFGGLYKNAWISLHSIVDWNKTERLINLVTETGRTVQIGRSSSQLLLGAFFRNSHLDMLKLDHSSETMKSIRKLTLDYISDFLQDPNLRELTLYDEASTE